MYRICFLLFATAVSFLTGCATPVAVRGLSSQLVVTQRAYVISLHSYFVAVEKFADAQAKIATARIDELTAQIDREYGTRANATLGGTLTPEARQKVLDELMREVSTNTGADLPLKRKITDAVASLKKQDQELEGAYQVIVTASEKLDEYIRLKKADETALGPLIQAVGGSNQKILAIVDAITALTQDLTQTVPKAQP
ncbi:MAG: hypothetical protein LAP39_24245 [Acidobacteriia bacterium]|nr:hypothetical protein [Terriglobia bacterium]